MKPTIGLTVVFFDGSTLIAAIVTFVHSDTCVNLRIFPDAPHDGGEAERKCSVTLDASRKSNYTFSMVKPEPLPQELTQKLDTPSAPLTVVEKKKEETKEEVKPNV